MKLLNVTPESPHMDIWSRHVGISLKHTGEPLSVIVERSGGNPAALFINTTGRCRIFNTKVRVRRWTGGLVFVSRVKQKVNITSFYLTAPRVDSSTAENSAQQMHYFLLFPESRSIETQITTLLVLDFL